VSAVMATIDLSMESINFKESCSTLKVSINLGLGPYWSCIAIYLHWGSWVWTILCSPHSTAESCDALHRPNRRRKGV